MREIFSSRLKKLREEKGYSMAALAKEIDATGVSIGYYERGERVPDIETLKKICDFFGVSADYLLGISDNPSTNEATKELCQTLGLSEKTISFLKGEYSSFEKIYTEEIYKGNEELKAAKEADPSLYEYELERANKEPIDVLKNVINKLAELHIDDVLSSFNDYLTSFVVLLDDYFKLIDEENDTIVFIGDHEKSGRIFIKSHETSAELIDDKAKYNERVILLKDILISETIQNITTSLTNKKNEVMESVYRKKNMYKDNGKLHVLYLSKEENDE